MYKILEEMPYEEFVGWFKYFRMRPSGWQDDLRTYQIMSSFAPIKKKPEELFGSLKAVSESEKSFKPKVHEGALPAGDILTRMLKAKGGDDEFDIDSFLKGVNSDDKSEFGGSGFSEGDEESSEGS